MTTTHHSPLTESTVSLCIGPKWIRRQTSFIVEIGDGVVGPGVADGGRAVDLGRGDDDRVAVDRRFAPDELAVGAGDRESLEFAPLCRLQINPHLLKHLPQRGELVLALGQFDLQALP